MTSSSEAPLRKTITGRACRLIAATCAVGLALSACGSSDTHPSSASGLSGRIVWADFGGPTNKARYKAYFDGFTKENGVKVTSEVYADAIANTMLTGGKGDYDAIHVGLDQVYAAGDNVQTLAADVPRDENLPADIRDKAFGTFIVSHAIGYLTSEFPNGGPKTWADFWDTEKYPGKRAWPGDPGNYDSSCEIAELAAGKSPDQLYPMDFNLCTEMLDKLRPEMVFYSAYPEIQQLLASKTAAMAVGPSGQYVALLNAGQDVTISWDQAIIAPNVMTIPKQAPDTQNVMALATYMADPKRQAEFAKLTGYGPGNPKAFDYMDEASKERIANSPSHTQTVNLDNQWRAQHTTDMLDWYTRWLSSQ
jgi:putative spermidine/putrescine transport system substrate-binding protein